MKLRDHFKLLLVCLSTLLSHVLSVAPGDLPSGCPASVTDSQRALIDSCCYNPLLSATTWIAVDSDSDEETWTSAMSADENCNQAVTICNSTDDWLVTQYINTTLDSGIRATQLPVDISCTGNCSLLELWIYQTNDADIDRTVVDFANTFTMVESVSSTLMLNGLNMDGLYLAVRAQSGACATINRLSIIATMCRGETIDFVTYPNSYASSAPVTGSCLSNSEPSNGALTAVCGSDGRWTTSASCVCSAGHTLNVNTCVECSQGTYKDRAGNDQCTDCPANSVAEGTGATMCTCEPNHARPTANLSDGCTECTGNFFIVGGRCMMCPMNSTSPGGNATSCRCIDNHTTRSGSATTSTTSDACVCQANYYENGAGECVECPRNSARDIDDDSSRCMCSGNTVTPGGSSTTTTEQCSSCPANSRGNSSITPLVCESCPERSERPFGSQLDMCTCLSGYQYGMGSKSDECLVGVIIPSSAVTLREGSAEDRAIFNLTLTNDSYMNLSVIINVDDTFRSRVSPNTNVMFKQGERQANVQISGNDRALDGNQTFQIEVQANDHYIGSGSIQITLEDDDVVGVGFLTSQSLAFNESDRMASITLNKNATTARDMQVNIVIPEGSSVSVSNPVTLPRGPPMNITVQLSIRNDVTGGEGDEPITLRLELVSPMEFIDLIDLTGAGEGLSGQLTIVIKDDDPPLPSGQVLSLYAIIGIAIGGAAVIVLLVLIVLVCTCICRFNANRRGFYFTDEDKTTAPPSMLRYSASLRSISSQSVVPIVGGKGQVAEKENEFYV